MIAALLLAVALPASAEFVVVEETESFTVYRDGIHVIVLADVQSQADLIRIAGERGGSVLHDWNRIDDRAARDAGVDRYYFRLRSMGNDIVCEKYARRPADQAMRLRVLSLIKSADC